jgi:hypothetical protein
MVTAHKIVKVEDRVERAKALLLEQFKDKQNINKIVDILVSEIQELDNAIVDVQELRTLSNAKGEQLEEIGAKLKVYRDNLGDEDYRTAIKVKILRSKSAGTENDIAEVIRLLLSDPSATITRPHPYTVELAAFLGCVGDTQAGIRQLAQFMPLNTNTRIVAKRSNVFCFVGGNGKGFSSYGGASGGQIASLVYSDYGTAQRKGYTTYKQSLPPVVTQNSPVLVSLPEVTGSIVTGSILVCTTGVWDSDLPLTYSYQWLRNGVPINAANNDAYTTVTEDEETNVSCQVIASNAAGLDSAVSNSILVLFEDPNDSGIDITSLPVSAIPSVTVSDGITIVTSSVELIFKSDGTWSLVKNGVEDTTGNYLTTTGVGAGGAYTISYQKLNTVDLITPTENAEITLSANVSFKQEIMSNYNLDVGGNYRVTITETSSGLFAQKDIYIGCLIVTTL